jgi:hypothetical protein
MRGSDEKIKKLRDDLDEFGDGLLEELAEQVQQEVLRRLGARATQVLVKVSFSGVGAGAGEPGTLVFDIEADNQELVALAEDIAEEALDSVLG